MSRTLVLILGDQLSPALSSLRGLDPARTTVLLCEVMGEASYVGHHQKKIAFIFAAMRHFAVELRDSGWTVDYVTLDDPDNTGTLAGEVTRAVQRHGASAVRVTEPGEWRVLADLQALDPAPEILPDDRFLCSHAEFQDWAEGRKALRMEYFYRLMRRKTGLLMDGDQPAGSQWNYDAENRKPAKRDLAMPRPLSFQPNAITRDVLALVEAHFPDNPGTLDSFDFAVTSADAARQQAHFFTHALPQFGDYQDAMLSGEPFLWHSILSPYINSGLLDPLALCREVDGRYRAGKVPLNAAEGFIRQIIGWREYVRGIYWREGPDYATRNALGARRPLPDFYWTGDTDLNCLKNAIGDTLARAYAHHIQRLMVTGNFALIAGIDPHALHLWYLAVYADAYEWVELPNTLGMSQFGDGGLLASKPYAASGAYINRMSDYCGDCRYDVKQRTGPNACPLNALYWDFLARNRVKLGSNQRLAMPYRNWDRMEAATQADIRASAAAFLTRLDGGAAGG